MRLFTVIGTHAGGEVYFEVIQAETPQEAMKSAFDPKEEGQPSAHLVYAVLDGAHQEIGLAPLGYIYPVTEEDPGNFEA